jgi:hypothetical protein
VQILDLFAHNLNPQAVDFKLTRFRRQCGNQIKLETYCSPKPINQ